MVEESFNLATITARDAIFTITISCADFHSNLISVRVVFPTKRIFANVTGVYPLQKVSILLALLACISCLSKLCLTCLLQVKPNMIFNIYLS